jgi:hypothetical protein
MGGRTRCNVGGCGWISDPGHKLSKEDVLQKMNAGIELKPVVSVSVLPIEDVKVEVHIDTDTVRRLERLSEDSVEGILLHLFSHAISSALSEKKLP